MTLKIIFITPSFQDSSTLAVALHHKDRDDVSLFKLCAFAKKQSSDERGGLHGGNRSPNHDQPRPLMECG
jgi:hypothetical protein